MGLIVHWFQLEYLLPGGDRFERAFGIGVGHAFKVVYSLVLALLGSNDGWFGGPTCYTPDKEGE